MLLHDIMRILFGPAGIPLSCKGRTVVDGIVDVGKLGLDVMEIQMLRPGEYTRDVDKIRTTSKDNNVKLFVHAPYYTNLAGGKSQIEKSMSLIKESGVFASRIGAEILIVHPGMYYKSRKASMETVVNNLRRLRDSFSNRKLKCKIGLETSGKQPLFGSIDEIVTVCKRVKGIVPVINFAHIHARGNGCLKTPEDFQSIFDKLKALKLKSYYTIFSGVVYKNGNEIDLTPIKKGDLKFDPLAECILKNKYNIIIISGSPLLEHDAQYMKLILDRVKEKLSKKKPVVKKVEKKSVKKRVIKRKPAKKKKKVTKKSRKPVKKMNIKSKEMKKPKKVMKKKIKKAKKVLKRKTTKKKVPKKVVKKNEEGKEAKKGFEKKMKKIGKVLKKPKKIMKKENLKKVVKKKVVKKSKVKKAKTRLELIRDAYEKKRKEYKKRKKAGKRR